MNGSTTGATIGATIGVFDSGHGGLTVLEALRRQLPQHSFLYYGDHAHAPYGEKDHAEILALTRTAVDWLFGQGCALVILACNTACAVALRTLQQEWLPTHPEHRGKKILGIIAPTVEAVTQTPWLMQTPVFPQKYNTDTVALFATPVTVESQVFATEIHKRCPHVTLAAQSCPGLVPLIEAGDPDNRLPELVSGYVRELLTALPPHTPTPAWAILGCTHYPLIEALFRAVLPPTTRLLDQPQAVANALEDFLSRHAVALPVTAATDAPSTARHVTTGNVALVSQVAALMTGRLTPFTPVS